MVLLYNWAPLTTHMHHEVYTVISVYWMSQPRCRHRCGLKSYALHCLIVAVVLCLLGRHMVGMDCSTMSGSRQRTMISGGAGYSEHKTQT